MFEGIVGRFLGGALWGLGAGVALTLIRGEGIRPLTKSAMKAYIAASERVQEVAAEARESIEDAYHEARTERQNGAHATPNISQRPRNAK